MAKKEQKFIKEENRFINDLGDRVYSYDAVKEFVDINYDEYFKTLPAGEYKKDILIKIFKNFLNRDVENGHREVKITKAHINFLKELPSDLIKRLFYMVLREMPKSLNLNIAMIALTNSHGRKQICQRRLLKHLTLSVSA